MNEATPLVLARTMTAQTYILKDPTGHGWGAFCTVNDSTGELHVLSDWGTWSYLWSPDPKHLGARSLTHFIAERGSVHYLADKLLGRRGSHRFSVSETTKHFQHELAAKRLEHGRMSEWMLEGRRNRGRTILTADKAREIWDELDSLASDISDDCEGAATLYVERFVQNPDLSILSVEPWEDTQTVETGESKVLRARILPALVAACQAEVAARAPKTWTCVICTTLHPIDHASIFLGKCGCQACCSCEVASRDGHTCPSSPTRILSLADVLLALSQAFGIPTQTRTMRVLHTLGVSDIDQLQKLTMVDLTSVRGYGPTCASRLQSTMVSLGLSLAVSRVSERRRAQHAMQR